MILELEQRNDLASALHDSFTPLLFQQMLWIRLNRRLYDIILNAGNYRIEVETVVDKANDDDWVPFLIQAAMDDQPQAPRLQAFLTKHPDLDPANGPQPVADYVMAHVLRGKRYFIDRKDLRLALKEMRSNDPRRVLVVNGERLSGKTYTRELISFLSEKTPKHRAVYIDLDKYVYEAPNLTETIGQQMGMDTNNIPKQDDEQKARWVQRLVGWIITRVVNPGDITYWFVFDGFREQTLLPETKDWIDELAVQAETNVPQCRVVLLNYKETLPLQISDYVSREEIKPIGRDELLDFFEQLNRDYKQKYGSDDLTGNVETILSQVEAAILSKPGSELERLRLLSKAVSETARLLFV